MSNFNQIYSKIFEENEEYNEQILLSLLSIKRSKNYENAIGFKWSDVKEEEDKEDIALAYFIESLQKQTDEEYFSKK